MRKRRDILPFGLYDYVTTRSFGIVDRSTVNLDAVVAVGKTRLDIDVPSEARLWVARLRPAEEPSIASTC